MHMIGHEAEGVNLATELTFPLGEVVEVIAVVVLGGKDRLSVMTALNDMVGIIGDDDAS